MHSENVNTPHIATVSNVEHRPISFKIVIKIVIFNGHQLNAHINSLYMKKKKQIER